MKLPVSWRIVRTPPADGAWNMACDLALMALARRDQVGILRVYEWSAPTVSFGRHERTKGVYSAHMLDDVGLAAVRRPTGGRALLHSQEVTYSVAVPIDDGSRWTAAYDQVNERLLCALVRLGIPAHIISASKHAPNLSTSMMDDSGSNVSTIHNAPSEIASGTERAVERATIATPHSESHVCFSGVAEGEIAVAARKLVASSVWRERGAYLQHGSILIHDDQSRLSPLIATGGQPPSPAATLAEWLSPSLSSSDIFDIVELTLQKAFGECGNARHWSIPTEVLPEILQQRTTLADTSWLWRR